MRSTIKLGLALGLVSLAVWGMPACGGDSDSDDGKKTGGTGGKDGGTGATGTGGYGALGGTTGGGTGGSTGGSGGSTGGTGGGQTITCGTESCQGYNVVVVTLPPCCATPAQDKCGVDIDETVAGTIGIEAGCFELEQAGNIDPGCPKLTIQQLGQDLPGCCNAAKSKCSYLADLSGFGGPNIGCIDPDNLPASEAGPPASCTPGQPGDGGTTDASTGGTGGTEAGTGGTSDAASGDATTD